MLAGRHRDESGGREALHGAEGRAGRERHQDRSAGQAGAQHPPTPLVRRDVVVTGLLIVRGNAVVGYVRHLLLPPVVLFCYKL